MDSINAAQRFEVVGDRGDGQDIVKIVLECIRIRAGGDQLAHRRMVSAKSSEMQRAAAVVVALIDIRRRLQRLRESFIILLYHGAKQARVAG
jgi:hypothetical protein